MPEFVRTPRGALRGTCRLRRPAARTHTAEGLRLHDLHFLDEDPGDAGDALLRHGEPTWSDLYHNVIPTLAGADYRCIAPDHIGFGKSDKVIGDDRYRASGTSSEKPG